ncbi:MipA/OmpV family protein [Paraglaciecola aestuariivivens]
MAFGLGVKTNPLVDGDNIPLVALLDLAWYGDKAYFDNGELGYQWYSQTNFAFESFLRLDEERAFFSFVHPANLLFNSDNLFPSGADNQLPTPPQARLSINQINKRDWAINAGLRGHYYTINGEWALSVEQDISQVHQGNKLSLSYQHHWQFQQTQITLQLGSHWKSRQLIDYYYGVSKQDTDLRQFHFNGQAGWQHFIGLNLLKPINEKWSWIAQMQHRVLPDSLTASPLIKENSINKLFVGVAYRF